MKKVVLSISAMLFVGAVSIAQPNVSAVGQIGVSNDGIVSQNGSNNHSTIGQLGNHNESIVDQGVLPGSFNATGNVAEVSQDNTSLAPNEVGNFGFISQNNKDNKAYQIQSGNDNHATIWQDQISGNIGGNYGDWAKQTQTGKHNNATIDQGTTGNDLPTAGVFTPAQIANMTANAPIPYVPDGGNKAEQTQTGDNNLAYASQGGERNISNQTQTSPTGTSSGNANVSRHFQYGADNTANSWQNGLRNTENTLQVGHDNKSIVNQTNLVGGPGNVQVGFSSGSFNNITVTQTNP